MIDVEQELKKLGEQRTQEDSELLWSHDILLVVGYLNLLIRLIHERFPETKNKAP